MSKIELVPIGHVKNHRLDIKDDYWGDVVSELILNPDYFDETSLTNIELFSHAHIVFYFDQVPDEKIRRGARNPRNNTDFELMGIFAQRTKNRMNKIGLTRCEIVKVEGASLFVKGLDAINNTPVLDIKPVMRQFDAITAADIKQPEWVDSLMDKYFLDEQ